VIDAVVTNYRTPWDLTAFATSFAEHAPRDARLWVVNVSPERGDEAAAAAVLELLGERCQVLATSENIGYGRACNWAAGLGSGRVLALFNADVELTPGALDCCAGALLANPHWGFLGPRQVDDHRRLTAAGIFGTLAAPRHRGWKEHDSGQYRDIRDDAVTVAGSALFVRRTLWRELASCPTFQPFNPYEPGALLPTPFGWDETYACYHAHAHGWRNVYFGEVTIVHRWHRAVTDHDDVSRRMKLSQEMFRQACDGHGLPHD
jgi:cellulose synthase/poly-beta-1,6-N-acetylglucosamine synthase-like glycosyltransferase